MADIPWTTLTVVLIVNIVLIEAASAVCGIAVARSTGSSSTKGVVVGLLLPVVGPAAWSLVTLAREPGRLKMTRGEGAPRTVLVALLAPALLAYAVSWLLPWGSAEIGARGVSSELEQTATGNPLSTLVVLGTIALVAVALFAVLTFSNRGRAVIVLASVASLWLLAMVDVWLVVGAADRLAGLASLVPDVGAEASVSVGPAVFAGMLGAALTMCAAIALLAVPSRPGTPPEPTPVAVSRGIEYGDGF